MRDALKRGQLAQSLGCNIETIRYYENIGLIGPADRSASGHRLYNKADADRLRFVLRLRQLGFSIGDIRSLLQTINSGDYSCNEIAQVAERHILTIQANHFLHNMIRIFMGTLLDIGKDNKEPQYLTDVLHARDRQAAGETFSPDGLYFKEVTYPPHAVLEKCPK